VGLHEAFVGSHGLMVRDRETLKRGLRCRILDPIEQRAGTSSDKFDGMEKLRLSLVRFPTVFTKVQALP